MKILVKIGSGGLTLIKNKYLNDRKKRLELEEISDLAIFGQVGGLIFCWLSGTAWINLCWFEPSKWLNYGRVLSPLMVLIFAFGLYMIFCGVIIPQWLNWFYKIFSYIGNKIGEIIFKILLTILYVIFVIPIGIIYNKHRQKYLYAFWDDKYPYDEREGFTDWKPADTSNKKGMAGTSLKLFGMLVNNGQYILIPVVIFLIALGIILFFVSSSVMAPFIYTLF